MDRPDPTNKTFLIFLIFLIFFSPPPLVSLWRPSALVASHSLDARPAPPRPGQFESSDFGCFFAGLSESPEELESELPWSSSPLAFWLGVFVSASVPAA